MLKTLLQKSKGPSIGDVCLKCINGHNDNNANNYLSLNSIHCCRYIPAGSDLELECQVDLGEHGPDDHYRQSHIYEKWSKVFCSFKTQKMGLWSSWVFILAIEGRQQHRTVFVPSFVMGR